MGKGGLLQQALGRCWQDSRSQAMGSVTLMTSWGHTATSQSCSQSVRPRLNSRARLEYLARDLHHYHHPAKCRQILPLHSNVLPLECKSVTRTHRYIPRVTCHWPERITPLPLLASPTQKRVSNPNTVNSTVGIMYWTLAVLVPPQRTGTAQHLNMLPAGITMKKKWWDSVSATERACCQNGGFRTLIILTSGSP